MRTKTIRKTYIENVKSKEWLDRNLKPNRQSSFIREAVQDKIIKTKALKNV